MYGTFSHDISYIDGICTLKAIGWLNVFFVMAKQLFLDYPDIYIVVMGLKTEFHQKCIHNFLNIQFMTKNTKIDFEK
jgi:hypothetical protein